MPTTRCSAHSALLALAGTLALIVGLSACSSSDDSSSKGATTTAASSSKSDGATTGTSDGSTSDNSVDSADLPDPCTLLTADEATEILGGTSAAAEPGATSVTGTSASCSWQTQEAKDHPTLDSAGHILTITVFGAPNASMTAKQLFESSASAGAKTEKADIDGCDQAFWLGGMLNALQGNVYVSATAGLADDSADAKAAVTKAITASCDALG